MRQEDKVAGARAMLDMPLFHLLMDEMEATAVNGCVNAKPIDHEGRAAFAAETRAIRSLRNKLKVLAEEGTAPGSSAPA